MRCHGQQDAAVAAFWERIDAGNYAKARGAVKPAEPSPTIEAGDPSGVVKDLLVSEH